MASLKTKGLSANLDPSLISWLNYSPTLKPEKTKLPLSKRSSTAELISEVSIGSVDGKSINAKDTPSGVGVAPSIGPAKAGSKLRFVKIIILNI